MIPKIRVVTIGGGGGHAQVLKALKTVPGLSITAICPSTDSGGSTGVLAQDYHSLGYLGDLTKCIAALCPDELLAKALMFRYDGGCFHGHSVKNMLFLALERTGGLQDALETMYRTCGLGEHRVIPVTTERTELCATLRIGSRIQGETHIDTIAKNPLWHPQYHAIQRVYLNPEIPASKDAVSALREAEWCVICPGDLYSSILPVLLPTGVKESFRDSARLKVVIVLNIMTKQGETDNYTAMDFVVQVEERIGRPCDLILCNNAPLPDKLLLQYALEQKVQLDPVSAERDPRVRLAPLSMVTEEGFLYHDPAKIRKELCKAFGLN